PSDDLPTLMFDPEAIHRAVLNVVTNALDACDGCDERRVAVTTRLDDEGRNALVEVTDSGVGIAADDMEKIFTVFVSKKGGRGTGLGLPVSQKILQEHGGLIRVESTPGEGSKFILELPVNQPRDGEEAPEDSGMMGATLG